MKFQSATLITSNTSVLQMGHEISIRHVDNLQHLSPTNGACTCHPTGHRPLLCRAPPHQAIRALRTQHSMAAGNEDGLLRPLHTHHAQQAIILF
mmetsp:Transcript_1318/g.2956  ORF Transcript_1318/g.2956 Transcript_1318/m.2956 type:complete len:94 (-) Transcript_1318:271-552(-)